MTTIGDRLGAWTLEELIGSGGMGRVFLGRNGQDSRAIKVIRKEDAQWRQMRSFVDEALVMSRLEHPNIVRVHELGEEQGTFFMVMEYVAGCSLDVLLDRMGSQGKGIEPQLAAWLVCEVAAGLEHAHENDVVHRDVTPHNILLSPAGSVKIADFGVAKAGGRAERTETGIIKGKIRYMAPEQARAEQVDARTDVYSLALVLWQMLTMRRPFEGLSRSKLLRAVQRGGICTPSTYAPDIPEEIEHALMCALQPTPDARPSSAGLFAASLNDAIVPGEAISALTSLLFEFTGRELQTASLRIGGSRSETIRDPNISGELTKRWTRNLAATPKVDPLEALVSDGWSVSSGGVMPTTSGGTPQKRSDVSVAVVSFVVGIVIAVILLWLSDS